MPLKEPAAPERINYLEEPYLEAPEGAVELSRGDTHLCPSPRSAKYVVQLLDDEGAIIEVIELSMWEEDMLGFTEASAGTGPGGHGRKVRAAKCRRGRGGMQLHSSNGKGLISLEPDGDMQIGALMSMRIFRDVDMLLPDPIAPEGTVNPVSETSVVTEGIRRKSRFSLDACLRWIGWRR